jgi:hypothetical protein
MQELEKLCGGCYKPPAGAAPAAIDVQKRSNSFGELQIKT